jgi:glutathione S-transferase
LCSTYADLSFVTWDMLVPWIFGDEAEGLQIEKNYPSYHAWNQRLMQRPAVQKIVQDKQKAMSGK